MGQRYCKLSFEVNNDREKNADSCFFFIQKENLSSDSKRSADAAINKARDAVKSGADSVKSGADTAASKAKKSYVRLVDEIIASEPSFHL